MNERDHHETELRVSRSRRFHAAAGRETRFLFLAMKGLRAGRPSSRQFRAEAGPLLGIGRRRLAFAGEYLGD